MKSEIEINPGDLANHPDVASNIALLEIWLQARLAYRGQPGTAVGIVYDQDLIYARGFGVADIEKKTPVTPESIFRIASHSKLFTSISIMQLRDQGKLQLDDSVKDYLPWFDLQHTFPEAQPITVRHLLTHTSGLPREAGSGYWLDFNFPTLAEVQARMPELATIFPSETRWKYSNLALTLAGAIIEVVSEFDFADYVQRNILDPLQMSSTSVVFPDNHADQLVTGYGRRLPDGSRETFPFVDARGMAAATGLSSSVADMARFVSWQFRLRKSNETELLMANTLREMQRLHWMQPDWQSGAGLGFSIQHSQDRDLIGHGGGYPGYLTSTRISPDEKVGVIVFTNSLDGTPQEASDRIFDWVAPAIGKAIKGSNGVNPDPNWAQLEGTYRQTWGDSHVLFLDGKLRMIDPTVDNPKLDALTLEPEDDGTFTLEGKGGGPLGERVVFEMGSDGKAFRVRTGVNWADRVSYPVLL